MTRGCHFASCNSQSLASRLAEPALACITQLQCLGRVLPGPSTFTCSWWLTAYCDAIQDADCLQADRGRHTFLTLLRTDSYLPLLEVGSAGLACTLIKVHTLHMYCLVLTRHPQAVELGSRQSIQNTTLLT